MVRLELDNFMFTGIIEEIGKVKKIIRGARSCSLQIAADRVLTGTRIGDSIAVNGVCLTVTEIQGGSFSADVMAETLRRSNLGKLSAGSPVNLERAMAADGRFGGHIVSGHIDGTGTISDFRREDNAVWITVSCKPDLLKYIIEKGSVTVDGVSLTVAYVDDVCFRVSVIPHTAKETTLLLHEKGTEVNLENDVIGKYVEKLLHVQKMEPENMSGDRGKVDLELLMKNGFV